MKTVVGASIFLLSISGVAREQTAAQNYKGLEVSVSSVSRATNVSLTDCPAGANTVRGVIKPGDQTEFAAITVDFKTTPAFKPGALPKPVLHDASGKTYNTAQSFGDVGSTPSFSCTFYYRVPKGTTVGKLAFENVSVDLKSVPQ